MFFHSDLQSPVCFARVSATIASCAIFCAVLVVGRERCVRAEPPAPIPFANVPAWQPSEPARPWKHLVFHHSATDTGSVASIHQAHLQRVDADGKPWRGIGYHFVIGNGQGMPDGKIEATFRWDEQLAGAHAGDREYNEAGIGICLIGNFEQSQPTAAQLRSLTRLATHLQQHYQIPLRSIVGHGSVQATRCPGRLFPWDDVRDRLQQPTRAPIKTSRLIVGEDAPAPTSESPAPQSVIR